MMVHKLSRYTALAAAILLAVLFISALQPGVAHAAAPGPLQTLPTWLEEALRSLIVALVKTLQDSARTGGVFLWGLLKLCGLVGLFGQEFSTLFGTVITEALEAVIGGSLHDLIRGSLMVSLGLFGLSLLARPFWPDLKLVSFRRAALWGIVIQAYLLNAPGIYTELETWRVTLAEEVAAAVSADAIPGCSGSVVEQLLCITGASPAEVFDPSLTALPDGLPYGGGESVRDLYDHCVYNPPVLYGDPACNPEEPVGDPWAVLAYAQDALGAQLLGLVIALLILAYGVLQIALGLAAGMMFVLFPAAALFAFYLPLESFPAGVVRNYVAIFLKSVVLLTLAAVVIRLFAVAVGGPGGGSLAAMAAVALVDLLLCLVMAKEALASLLGSISFVGSSVSALGAAVDLTGSGGGAAAALPGAESRAAASLIGGGAVTQTLMGAPHPYGGAQGPGPLGAGGAALGAPARGARAALQMALAAGSGGAGAVAGALAAARLTDAPPGAGYGSLALMGSAATTVLGRSAGRGFVTGAGLAATRQLLTRDPGVDAAARPPGATPPSPAPALSSLLVPDPPSQSTVPSTNRTASLLPAEPVSGLPATVAPLQDLLLGGEADLSGWTPASARQIERAAARLEPASPAVENAAVDLARAGHQHAGRWQRRGQSPILDGGRLDPLFVEEVVAQQPEAAAALVAEQKAAGIPPRKQLCIGAAVALGVTMQRPGADAVREIPRPPATRPAQTSTPKAPAPETVGPEPEPDPALFERLRTWRLEAARQERQKAFYVFPDATLQRIAAARPQTPEELQAVKGVGPKKLAQYGDAVLDVTRQEPGQTQEESSREVEE